MKKKIIQFNNKSGKGESSRLLYSTTGKKYFFSEWTLVILYKHYNYTYYIKLTIKKSTNWHHSKCQTTYNWYHVLVL